MKSDTSGTGTPNKTVELTALLKDERNCCNGCKTRRLEPQFWIYRPVEPSKKATYFQGNEKVV